MSRRTFLFAVMGFALAGALAVILFAGVGVGRTTGNGGPTPIASSAGAAPGINGPTTSLLSLAALPASATRQAPSFSLTDQAGTVLSPASFRGKVVVLSFNDDQCTDVCTLLAEDIVAADSDLGSAASDVVWLGVNANPFYPQVQYVRAWSDEHGLGSQANWYFVTGSPTALKEVWKEYGVTVVLDEANRTVQHSTEMWFIGPDGREEALAEFGDASADTAQFAHGIAQMAADLMPNSSQIHVAGPEAETPTATNASIGANAATIRLAYLTGGRGTFDSASRGGKPLVVNFWASSCVLCRAELPALEAAYRTTHKSVDFVGVDVSDSTSRAKAVVAAAGITYPVVSDPDGQAAAAEAITGLPYTVIVSPNGQIAIRHPGAFTAEQLEYLLEDYDTPG